MSSTKCFYLVNNEQVLNEPVNSRKNQFNYTLSSQKFALTKSYDKLLFQMIQDIHFNFLGNKNKEIDIYLVSIINTGNITKNRQHILDYFNKERSSKYNVDIIFNLKGFLGDYDRNENILKLKPKLVNTKDISLTNSDAQMKLELENLTLDFSVFHYDNKLLYVCNPSLEISIVFINKLIGNYNVL